MSEVSTNDVIGYQRVATGETLESRTPLDFKESHQELENPNLYYDSVKGWTIIDGTYINQRLRENENFEYGSDLDVQANWMRKVQATIFCYGQSQQAGSDLSNNVQVNGGVNNGSSENMVWGFFQYNTTAIMNVTGTDENRRISVGYGRSYTFIGWTDELPLLYYTNEPNIWITNALSYAFSTTPESFSSDYLNNKYCVFLEKNNIEIVVRTNKNEFNCDTTPASNLQYTFATSSSRPEPKRFDGTNPIEITTITDFGNSFTCTAPQNAPGGYVFSGWYMIDGGTETQLTNSNTLTTPYILMIKRSITLEARYELSGTVYTITYHSGLPET